MPKKVFTRTGKAGDTANDRRIVAVTSEPLPINKPGTVWAAPSQPGDGQLLQRNEFIHLFSMLNDGVAAPDPATYYTVQVWWYTPISGNWHMGETLTINANDVATIEVQGFDRVYVQVTTVSYDPAFDTPSLDMWLGLVVPV